MTNKEELSDLMSMAKCHACLEGKQVSPKYGSLIQIFTKDDEVGTYKNITALQLKK